MSPPTPVALGHVHANVNGVVTCGERGCWWREGTERKRESRVKLTENTADVELSGEMTPLNVCGAALEEKSMMPAKTPDSHFSAPPCLHNMASGLHAVFTCSCVMTSGRVCLPVTQKPAAYRLNSTDEAPRLIFRITTT